MSIIFVLNLKSEIKIKFLISLVSLGLTILTFEIFLNFSNERYSLETKIDRAAKLGIEFDSRTVLDVLEHLNNEENSVYPNFKPKFLLVEDYYYRDGFSTDDNNKIFPLSNISNISTILTNENGFYPVVKTDDYGFTNPLNIYNENIDIMLIGDSYVEGYSVNSNNSLSSNLNASGYKSVSLGKGGNGPLVELATLNEYAKPFEPSIVIWFFVHNDFRNLHYELRSNLLTNYLTDQNFDQDLISKQNDIDIFIKDYIRSEQEELNQNYFDLINTSKIIEIIKLSQLRVYFIDTLMYFNSQQNYEILEKVLMNANSEVKSWGGEFYFVYLPSLQTLNNLSSDNSKSIFSLNKFEEKSTIEDIYEICRKLNIEIIDFYFQITKLENYKSVFPLESDGHYNKKGYKLLSETIINGITK